VLQDLHHRPEARGRLAESTDSLLAYNTRSSNLLNVVLRLM
jgi:hypothetical protein